MHYIYVLMGKSCSGKNSVAENLLGRSDLNLRRVVTYTTRPKRAGEKDGREYHFVTRNFYSAQAAAGTVIDYHEYKTVDGLWYYFTADDGQIDLAEHDSLIIGTPGIVKNLQNYYGEECVVPILLMVSDGELLRRALGRESRQFHGNYAEMCRRFLADKEDFSDETIKSLGHVYTVENNVLTHCSAEIAKIMADNQGVWPNQRGPVRNVRPRNQVWCH